MKKEIGSSLDQSQINPHDLTDNLIVASDTKNLMAKSKRFEMWFKYKSTDKLMIQVNKSFGCFYLQFYWNMLVSVITYFYLIKKERINSIKASILIGYALILCLVYLNNYFHLVQNLRLKTRSQVLLSLNFTAVIWTTIEVIDLTDLGFGQKVNEATIHCANGLDYYLFSFQSFISRRSFSLF